MEQLVFNLVYAAIFYVIVGIPIAILGSSFENALVRVVSRQAVHDTSRFPLGHRDTPGVPRSARVPA
jgi:hypothetical protein